MSMSVALAVKMRRDDYSFSCCAEDAVGIA